MNRVKEYFDALCREIAAQPEIEDHEKLIEIEEKDRVLGFLPMELRKVYQLQYAAATRLNELADKYSDSHCTPAEIDEGQALYTKGRILTELFWQLAREEFGVLGAAKSLGIRRRFVCVDSSQKIEEEEEKAAQAMDAVIGQALATLFSSQVN